MIIWLIGMSGAGKSTLAQSLYTSLKPEHSNLVLIDGDAFREVFANDADHSVEGRAVNAARISHLCHALDQQDIHVIAAVLSIFPKWQSWNRKEFSEYFEIFLDIPLATLRSRDPKGLHEAAANGALDNMVGYDIPFPRPAQPDLIIDEIQQRTGVGACTSHILSFLPVLN